jgi:predicted RNA binding protein YcfA (HicA-like mRNA interferase family)
MLWNQGSRLKLYTFVCILSPVMQSREVIAAVKAAGWYEVAKRGSHVQFKHPTWPGRVTVPHPKRDIPKGTLRSIERQARIKL